MEERVVLSAAPNVVGVEVSSTQWTAPFHQHLESSGLGTEGYRIPTGSAAQSTALSWENIDQIHIVFSEDVHVDIEDLAVTGVAISQYAYSSFFYDPQIATATWTLASSLALGERVQLDLDSDGVDPVTGLSGNLLDGEWVDEVTTAASGDGVAGGDFEFRFNVVEGDTWASSSNNVNLFDYALSGARIGLVAGDSLYKVRYDVNGDAWIDNQDFQIVLSQMGGGLPAGTPLGEIGDAPTAGEFGYLSITNRDIDYALSLYDVFDDLEDSDSSLTYTVVGQSSSQLMDDVSINSSTGEITLNAASTGVGRNQVTVRATDQSGMSVDAVLTVDIGYANAPPVITNYIAEILEADVWEISGTVSDVDDDVEGMIVTLTGVVDTRAVVREDGTFSVLVAIHPGTFGWEYASVSDDHGGMSNAPATYIGLT